MYVVILDMIQNDCPFINSSEKSEVAYYLTHWDFTKDQLINRGFVLATSSEELQNSLASLVKHPKFLELDIDSRERNTAIIKTKIKFTDAMAVIKRNCGYIIGPFHVKGGREIWQVGFDTYKNMNNALSELDKKNDFKILKEYKLTITNFSKLLPVLQEIIEFITEIDSLTYGEKLIIDKAIKLGFLEDPKRIRIEDLAKEIGISSGYLSRKIRKIENRVFQHIHRIINKLEKIDSEGCFKDEKN